MATQESKGFFRTLLNNIETHKTEYIAKNDKKIYTSRYFINLTSPYITVRDKDLKVNYMIGDAFKKEFIEFINEYLNKNKDKVTRLI